jgi:hypothetical protein
VTASGGTLYTEQTCHHPPISNFHFKGPPDCPWEFFGHFEYRLNMWKTMQGAEFTQPGK